MHTLVRDVPVLYAHGDLYGWVLGCADDLHHCARFGVSDYGDVVLLSVGAVGLSPSDVASICSSISSSINSNISSGINISSGFVGIIFDRTRLSYVVIGGGRVKFGIIVGWRN